MPCPEFFYFLRPALEAIAERPDAHWREVGEYSSRALALSEQDRTEVVASGTKSKFEDRVQWALTYLRQAGLIERSGRGRNRVTDRGTQYLERAPSIVKPSDLEEFPEYVDFQSRQRSSRGTSNRESVAAVQLEITDVTPLERVTTAIDEIRTELAQTLLEHLKSVTPQRFEQIIVDLMLRLGYGGARDDAGQALGKTGDGGIDGVIRQDRLGLDNIYLQAKRWADNTVGTGEVNGFIGALATRGATKGVLITTSTFSDTARAVAVTNPQFKVSLIDGKELARLMIDHNLGVAVEESFEVKRLDSDYFFEE